ncbi:MAG: glutathione S-transferase family protein [Bradyrhizobium sp.]|uniref:glutathione S-transferase family protein n=1 Tax=Bradyrhizobium sp. TaxID=376 RepID=UPI001DA9BB45|nr:glutathione S-transferase family protein [Bradyrhizobium sp.]MBV9565285.1 glutathione S-transferase family protein [Bradyrhizobium sp.]
MPASPIILHHFDESPFSEKIRLIFGLKKLAWSSVRISRIMPRPDLMPLTGGYRRTPVLQIGADIYCDTQCIMRELERRFPEPMLLPKGYQGLAWGSAMWTDRSFFQNTVNLVFGTNADRVPAEFIADREKLRGAKFDVAAMKDAIPQMRDQFRAHLQWIDAQLADEREWIAGDTPSLCDINAYMNLWYVRSNLENVDEMLGEFDHARAWAGRLRAVGHGTRQEMTSAEALEIATRATPETVEQHDPGDPNGRKPGDRVEVVPDDYGKVRVAGEIVALSPQHIAIRRHDPRAREVVVQFPRAGFHVFAA